MMTFHELIILILCPFWTEIKLSQGFEAEAEEPDILNLVNRKEERG